MHINTHTKKETRIYNFIYLFICLYAHTYAFTHKEIYTNTRVLMVLDNTRFPFKLGRRLKLNIS